MRKLAAVWLFAVLLTPLVFPYFASQAKDPDSNLPACCRRDGKHHCAMMAATASSETEFQSLPADCPYRETAKLATPAYRPVTISTQLVRDERSAEETPEEAVGKLQSAEACSHLERGPPIFS